MTYPVMCSRCGTVEIRSAAENNGTDDAPLCIVCWWELLGDAPTGDEEDRVMTARLWPEVDCAD